MKNKKKANKNVENKVVNKPFISSLVDGLIKHIAIRETYEIIEPYIDVLKEIVSNIF